VENGVAQVYFVKYCPTTQYSGHNIIIHNTLNFNSIIDVTNFLIFEQKNSEKNSLFHYMKFRLRNLHNYHLKVKKKTSKI